MEFLDSKDTPIHLTISKPNIKDLLKYLLAEIKGFEYPITLKEWLSQYKGTTERKFAPVYHNSARKIITGLENKLDESFQEVFNRIDNWISDRSGWVIE